MAFADGNRGLAVGAHGAAVATSDGGAHWVDASLGRDLALDDVLFLDDGSALVGATGGAVLRFRAP